MDAVVSMPLRSASAREGGALRGLLPEEVGAQVLAAVVARSGVDPGRIEDVLVGNQAVPARMARHVAVLAGLPVEVPGVTVSRGCASGLEAVVLAAQAVRAGAAQLLVAGGVESYTRAPYLLDKPTEAYQRRPPRFLGAETRGDLGDPELGLGMGMGLTAEAVAQAFGITRERQDAFALQSQRRAAAAMAADLFAGHTVPIELGGRGSAARETYTLDECPRPDTTAEALARLRPAFQEGGTVTAGNSCRRADGAAMMLVSTMAAADELGLEPRARLVSAATVGVVPRLMGIGPVPAVGLALEKAGLSVSDLAVVELNEAFAAQAVAVVDQLGLDPQLVNPRGGAIAFGHPTGATGALLVPKLLDELDRRDARYGVVTMCVGSGMGSAAIFERIRP